ncbi:MAG TPA: hypothetical protein PK033_09830 [Acetivibrio sp.]|nr:hypothetical protein [Clostridium sp.]HQA58159.1 hypothetical protein [Acetivibrio sp.]
MKQKDNLQYEDDLNKKIEARLREMESKDYVFAKRFSKMDYIIVLLVVIFCFIFLIIGAYL